MENVSYTYIYLDIRKSGNYNYDEYHFDYEPFYVGKGKGNRYLEHTYKNKDTEHLWSSRKMRSIFRETGNFPLCIKIKENISDKEAITLEIKMISLIGRSDRKKGPLVNLTDGGEGAVGAIRKVMSQESRDKLSKSKKDVKFSDSHKKNLSIARSKVKYSKIVCDNISNRMKNTTYAKGSKRTPEHLAKMVAGRVKFKPFKKVIQYSLNDDFIKEWPSVKEICLFYNIGTSTMFTACKNYNKGRTSIGFKWKYK